MRIIGGKDFYDGAVSYGIDNSVVLLRTDHRKAEPVEMDLGNHHVHLSISTNNVRRFSRGNYSLSFETVDYRYRKIHFSFVHVILAGKIYRGVKHLTQDRQTHWVEVEYIWDPEYLRDKLEEHNFYFYGSLYDPYHKRMATECANGIGKPNELPSSVIDTLVNNRISTAISHSPDEGKLWRTGGDVAKWYLNTDGLKDIGFAKAIHPTQAYQELSMWVGSTLPQLGNPIVEIENEKVKLAKHSMDKWSFRKPGKKGM